jgi:hypothetical protein
MQIKRAVRLAAVEVDRHADYRGMRQYQRGQQSLPPQQGKQAVREKCQGSTKQVGLLSIAKQSVGMTRANPLRFPRFIQVVAALLSVAQQKRTQGETIARQPSMRKLGR